MMFSIRTMNEAMMDPGRAFQKEKQEREVGFPLVSEILLGALWWDVSFKKRLDKKKGGEFVKRAFSRDDDMFFLGKGAVVPYYLGRFQFPCFGQPFFPCCCCCFPLCLSFRAAVPR